MMSLRQQLTSLRKQIQEVNAAFGTQLEIAYAGWFIVSVGDERVFNGFYSEVQAFLAGMRFAAKLEPVQRCVESYSPETPYVDAIGEQQ